MFSVVNCFLFDDFYRCLETCYWHLIEKRFCFDESIALYQEPEKNRNERNNNIFDNIAFYDSVAVIAGRAIVTIDPIHPKNQPQNNNKPIVQQPQRAMKKEPSELSIKYNVLKQVPSIIEEKASTTDTDGTESDTVEKSMLKIPELKPKDKKLIQKSVSFHNLPAEKSTDEDEEEKSSSTNNLSPTDQELTLRKKSLRERRMSKSLYLKIDHTKELPIIRQNSMPKFYLDTPQESQMTESSIVKDYTLAFTSPKTTSSEFTFDLYSVVQIEKSKSHQMLKDNPNCIPSVHRGCSQASKFSQIKGKIMLRKSKSTVSASSVPYSNYI